MAITPATVESVILIPGDKANHMIYGFLIGLGFAIFARFVWHNPFYPLTPILAAAIVGALKELLDWYGNEKALHENKPPAHDVDFWDFVATTSGGIAATIAIYLG